MEKDYAPYPDKHPTFHDYHDFSLLTLFDLSYQETSSNSAPIRMPTSDRVVFEHLSGYRPYDEAVLLFCYDGPKSRAEIQSLTTYKSPKGVIEGV
jgi:hypothetical protein